MTWPLLDWIAGAGEDWPGGWSSDMDGRVYAAGIDYPKKTFIYPAVPAVPLVDNPAWSWITF